jgi:hypothetical protein
MKPWHKVVTPREDLREGRPLDASEFAVHLDHVRDGRAPEDYQKPERFFERTYLTANLSGLSAEVLRRLSGVKTETSAVFNMTTQFGGGKTHALTLLYHLAKGGPSASSWKGVNSLLDKAGVKKVPQAAVAVFVGTEFDSLRGRGGDDGTPLRKTPWGEIAFQLGGKEAFAKLAGHEKEMRAPAGDAIRDFLPKDRPILILMDELMNFVSTNRKSGLSGQLHSFVQNLSEEARAHDRMVLAISVPASEMEMNAEDIADYDRLKKMLDRVGKAVVMSAENETAEIIRRRLFEWGGVPEDGRKAISEYVDWVNEHKQQLPQWFPFDNTREQFEATYPFHPRVLSVFQDKWRSLPRFQQTRGILRLLALWVSRAYQEDYKSANKDPLITLGTAPLEDANFRAALFEQLGEARLEGAVTTDICGKADSHAMRLDKEALDTLKKARLHRKVATSILFESNGGAAKDVAATVPEIRLAVAEPDMDIGNVETVLESLTDACYYLAVEKNRYRFSFKENLNKRFADRKANIPGKQVEERIKEEILKVFPANQGLERVFFPEKSGDIADRPALTLVVMAPERGLGEKGIVAAMEEMTRNCGNSARTFKSALIWAATNGDDSLKEEAKKSLAWEDIADENLPLDDSQKKQVSENIKKAERDLKEAVWRSYRYVVLLGRDNALRTVDLGLITSSSAGSMVECILTRLRQEDEVTDGFSPNKLVKVWPAAEEWSTKSVRDAFYASPLLPRLLKSSAVQATIAQGVAAKVLAFVGKSADGGYEPFSFGQALNPFEVEISEDFFIIRKETAEAYLKAKASGEPLKIEKQVYKIPNGMPEGTPGIKETPAVPGQHPTPPALPWARTITWSGEVPAQKWMNFYTRVLSKFATGPDLKLTLKVQVNNQEGIPNARVEETKAALRELGLDDKVDTD